MREPLDFFVAGLPKGQPRIRAVNRGKFAGVYDPGTANDWKAAVRQEAQDAWDGIPFTGPIGLDLFFWFPRPKSHFNAKGIRKDTAPRWHTHRPDRDNLDKAILDTLKNLGVFIDDAQVCIGKISKQYTETNGGAGVNIELYEAEP